MPEYPVPIYISVSVEANKSIKKCFKVKKMKYRIVFDDDIEFNEYEAN